jgi:hypothetical protein
MIFAHNNNRIDSPATCMIGNRRPIQKTIIQCLTLQLEKIVQTKLPIPQTVHTNLILRHKG